MSKEIVNIIDPKLLSAGGVEIIRLSAEHERLRKEYGIPLSEIMHIDLNRTGVHLPNSEVRVGYRARFIATFNNPSEEKTWVALPVRSKTDTAYSVHDDALFFNDVRM